MLSVYAARYSNRCGNFGDESSAWILRALGREVEVVAEPQQASLFAVGSVLDRLPAWRRPVGSQALVDCGPEPRYDDGLRRMRLADRAEDVPAGERKIAVWGSGLIHEDHRCRVSPHVKAFAVRGPLTRARMVPRGGDESLLGDPGIFAREALAACDPGFVPRRLYRLGFIPHYVDMDAEELCVTARRYPDDVTVIDPCTHPADVARRISECDVIASSSLHGLIFAESLRVPSVWVRFSDKVAGGSFKFRDWQGALGWPDAVPIVMDGSRAVTLAELVSGAMYNPGASEPMRGRLLSALARAEEWLAEDEEDEEDEEDPTHDYAVEPEVTDL